MTVISTGPSPEPAYTTVMLAILLFQALTVYVQRRIPRNLNGQPSADCLGLFILIPKPGTPLMGTCLLRHTDRLTISERTLTRTQLFLKRFRSRLFQVIPFPYFMYRYR